MSQSNLTYNDAESVSVNSVIRYCEECDTQLPTKCDTRKKYCDFCRALRDQLEGVERVRKYRMKMGVLVN